MKVILSGDKSKIFFVMAVLLNGAGLSNEQTKEVSDHIAEKGLEAISNIANRMASAINNNDQEITITL